MEKCKDCVDGLKHQGESIATVCATCKGTGKGVELGEPVASVPAIDLGEVPASESFSTESEEVGAISEGEVRAPE